jgi:ComF family protein
MILPDLPPLYGWGLYDGHLKQTLAKLKYNRQSRIAEPLGQWLGQFCLDQTQLNENFMRDPPCVVPIPLHRDRQRERGYNQAELIARSFCQVSGLPLKPQGLIRTQATLPQYGLTRGDRFRNLQNVFHLGPDLQKMPNHRHLMLVDDIFTTGATCKSAIATLNHHGFQVTGRQGAHNFAPKDLG